MINELKLKQILAAACAKAEGQSNWATLNNVSSQYVSDCLQNKRKIGKKILAALKYKKVLFYEKVK